MRVTGDWPNPIAIPKGWARAHARPWTRTRPEAYLRLVRGSAHFLGLATAQTLELGPPAVISPPLMPSSQQPWLAAGYRGYTSLQLLRKPIETESPSLIPVTEVHHPDWARIIEIDGAAFGADWQAELPALNEAMKSAGTTAMLGISDPGGGAELAGYAIVGVSAATGYLQRLAVTPALQRQGLGRSLTRSSVNWCRRRGARQVVLNTKPDNQAAQKMYISEGFQLLPDRLELLRYGDSVSP